MGREKERSNDFEIGHALLILLHNCNLHGLLTLIMEIGEADLFSRERLVCVRI